MAKKISVRERLKKPHILQEMLQTALTLSADAQRDFLGRLSHVAQSIREMLDSEGLISVLDINHQSLWAEVAGKPLAFIDGGMASIGSLGAEPIAVRVGSYTVIPGMAGEDREKFTLEKQLVDELFETASGRGIFEDGFDDVAKLRESARICAELAGANNALHSKPQPTHLFVHGALVNPVSPYALDGFPNFTERAIRSFLPTGEHQVTGRDANFIAVYLRQLELLAASGTQVCGVVERPSNSALVIRTLLDRLKGTASNPGHSVIEALWRQITDYRLNDGILFHAMLDEGEYVSPVEVNRNDLARAPAAWQTEIGRYPKPWITYLRMGEMSRPVRCEFFGNQPAGNELAMRIILHSCRLMPRYAFPAGLDIVDKYAKVPDWMSRPINSAMATQILRKALESGNSGLIAEAKRLVCGTARDWMFRPNFERNG